MSFDFCYYNKLLQKNYDESLRLPNYRHHALHSDDGRPAFTAHFCGSLRKGRSDSKAKNEIGPVRPNDSDGIQFFRHNFLLLALFEGDEV